MTFCGKSASPLFPPHDGTACSMEIKPLESGLGLRSNRAAERLDLFHHARSEARYSLPSVPTLLRGRPELLDAAFGEPFKRFKVFNHPRALFIIHTKERRNEYLILNHPAIMLARRLSPNPHSKTYFIIGTFLP